MRGTAHLANSAVGIRFTADHTSKSELTKSWIDRSADEAVTMRAAIGVHLAPIPRRNRRRRHSAAREDAGRKALATAPLAIVDFSTTTDGWGGCRRGWSRRSEARSAFCHAVTGMAVSVHGGIAGTAGAEAVLAVGNTRAVEHRRSNRCWGRRSTRWGPIEYRRFLKSVFRCSPIGNQAIQESRRNTVQARWEWDLGAAVVANWVRGTAVGLEGNPIDGERLLK